MQQSADLLRDLEQRALAVRGAQAVERRLWIVRGLVSRQVGLFVQRRLDRDPDDDEAVVLRGGEDGRKLLAGDELRGEEALCDEQHRDFRPGQRCIDLASPLLAGADALVRPELDSRFPDQRHENRFEPFQPLRIAVAVADEDLIAFHRLFYGAGAAIFEDRFLRIKGRQRRIRS